ncbi:manganese superoxide dismutase [Klebsormidium nitens]|uniref:Superoxide dismutase n=1 Tax=Klebsormidium nitens TaxID=105231 RepID=A0A1Y1IBN5_KLENI|nr:manganese superoxide dismutase [Klebsormidium nitens]|eukprot:GAQ87983.1 manganese superoxide dismutase [Klebsormidium nitens]
MLRHALRSLAPSSRQACAAGAARSVHTVSVPPLDYDYGELEPVISGEIMRLHHQKHHQAYVTGYNTALEKLEGAQAKGDTPAIVALQSAINFNGGGHINHSIFWKNLAPPAKGGGEPPSGPLAAALDQEFGSLDAFKSKFAATTAAVQGSGWGWLAYNPDTHHILITTTPNQDPVSARGLVPLLGVDVWEHAYYLQYKNVRPDYLKAIWKVVNWKDVEKRFAAASS